MRAQFAEFYVTDHRGTVPGTGDRSVIRLDARERSESHHALALEWAARHGFTHYRLFRGRMTCPAYTSALVEASGGSRP